jgi:hypothetical protein
LTRIGDEEEKRENERSPKGFKKSNSLGITFVICRNVSDKFGDVRGTLNVVMCIFITEGFGFSIHNNKFLSYLCLARRLLSRYWRIETRCSKSSLESVKR